MLWGGVGYLQPECCFGRVWWEGKPCSHFARRASRLSWAQAAKRVVNSSSRWFTPACSKIV